ncbi:hypothetical protein MRX96_006991 [Rhipicephalus microplus]
MLEQPVAYASRTLTKTECIYAKIDREALAIVYAVRNFHEYLCDREFTIITDHKPFPGIFQRDKQIQVVLSPRMLRWFVMLSAYEYKLKYKKAHDHGNADCFSRLPISVDRPDIKPPGDVLMLEAVEYPSVRADEVTSANLPDPWVSRVNKRHSMPHKETGKNASRTHAGKELPFCLVKHAAQPRRHKLYEAAKVDVQTW